VCAQDKSAGKSNHITIANEKGKQSRAEFGRMLQETEEYVAGEEANKSTIEAAKGFEHCCSHWGARCRR